MNRTLRNLSLAAGGIATGTALYARFIEPRWLRYTRPVLYYSDLPRPLEGLRIALLSDLHAGRLTPVRLLARMVEMTMRERPHLIAVTGDLVNGAAALPRVLRRLSELSAPLGVYVVPGNHDHHMGIALWHAAVAGSPPLVDLTNAARVLPVRGPGSGEVARLCIAGVDDLSEGEPRLDMLPPRDSRDFTILLAHQPDQAEHVRRHVDDVDLVLSGHTHGGQVRLPGFGALVNSARRADLYESGVRRRPWTQVYTSTGIGTVHLPVRFMARPEIAILTLSSAPRPQRRRRQPGPVS